MQLHAILPSLAALLACGLAPCAAQEPPSPADLEHFERAVRPLLVERCAECHAGERPKAGLRVDHVEHLRNGGESGPALVPGRPEESRLFRAVSYTDVELRMPPSGKLPDAEIEVLREWIARGAPWPKEPVPSAAGAPEEAFDLAARRAAHWCWSALAAPALPAVAEPGWARDDLDRFVAAAREAQGLSYADEAPASTWLRRVSFDLLGLPPSAEEVLALGEHPSEEQRAAAVDRLLASPRFGERWGRHWLDLVRYAETYGHEFDYEIPEAWRYRDYVIRALNADLPYDTFVREHIAGDLLPAPRLHPEEGTNESILATGFWFFPQATHAPVDVRADEADRIDNAIDVFSKTFLGLTVACARCHDHKFDAISARDYYALAGVLQSTRRQIAYLDPQGRLAAGARASARRAEAATAALHAGAGAALLPPLALELEALFALAPTLPPTPREHELEELSRVSEPRGSAAPQAMREFGPHWSGERQLFWTGGRVGDALELRFRVERAGERELVLHATRAPDYAIVDVALDGAELLAGLDLYAPRVEPTGEVALGRRHLTVGEHVLRVAIRGAAERAVKKHFVGLDRLVLRPPGDPVAEAAALIERCAAAHRVRPERLARWSAALRGEAARVRGTPLALLAELAGSSERAERERAFAAARRAAEDELRAQAEALTATEVIARFDGDFEGWTETGEAFGGRPTRTGEWDPRSGVAGFAAGGRADSGRLQPKLQGALRSPTFEITQPRLFWKLAGTGGQVRLIVDSYVMDTYNALIFGDVSFGVDTGGKTLWRTQGGDVGRFLGHRAHLEILDDGDGWIAVDEIRAGAGEIPAAPTAATRAWLASEGDLAAAFAARIERALVACAEGALDEEAREWLELLTRAELLELPADARETLTAAHAGWTQQERELPHPARALAALDGTPENEYVHLRGSWRNRGPEVPRGFLAALGGEALCALPDRSGRLELADALLDPANPLPARVLVNRVWHHLFGRGLVPTTDDFGVLGERPTHPELLDHLAHWFRGEGGWSLKRLLRRLVLSSTYRMSSRAADARSEELDPAAQWLHRARVRRLQGEALRDAMLAVSGRLDPTMYGPPVALHLTAFLEGRGRPGHSGPVDGAGRRTIYQAVRRNFLPPFQMAFDMPVPFSTTGRRSVSNVPAQALALMNDPFVREMARHWAERVLARPLEDDRARLRHMYLEAFARAPLASELDAALAFVAEQRATHGESAEGERETWADVAHVLFQVKEFQFLD